MTAVDAGRFVIAVFSGAFSPKMRILAIVYLLGTEHLVEVSDLIIYTFIYLGASMFMELRQ